jgi:hypothetical protein
MKCKISCSFGEVVDKLTILKIKEKKAINDETLYNIRNEMNAICSEIKEVNNTDPLFSELFNINNKLWILEDLIREKSRKQEYDPQYILYSENIHKTNDERYEIKRKINSKYDSLFKEEKLYKTIQNTYQNALEAGKNHYTAGQYDKSLEILSKLWNQHKNIKESEYNDFFIDLLFSCVNIFSIYNIQHQLHIYVENVMNKIQDINVSISLKNHIYFIYTCYSLRNGDYMKAYPYLNLLNNIQGPGVNAETMSFFKTHDENRTLLLYDGGGLGDKFMLCRFIPILCNKYMKNHIVFFINDEICWFFEQMEKDHTNLQLIKYSKPSKIPKFDYHCSLMYLIKELNITNENLMFNPMFCHMGMIHSKYKNKYIINWKGNDKNIHEKHNRKIELQYVEKLLQIPNIEFICITQNISNEERAILKKYKVECAEHIDKGTNSFEDSVNIIRSCNGVITTDTSIAHLSLNMDVKTYVMLTKGHEWRWGSNDTTNWYPNAILVKQTKQGDWSNVINKIIDLLHVEKTAT